MSLRQKYPGLALRMRITFGNFVYVSFAIVFACCQSQVASAKVPVNVDDLDPLLECKRRDVSGKCNTSDVVTKDFELTCRSCGEQ
jgi:hypothetical protein